MFMHKPEFADTFKQPSRDSSPKMKKQPSKYDVRRSSKGFESAKEQDPEDMPNLTSVKNKKIPVPRKDEDEDDMAFLGSDDDDQVDSPIQ